MTKQSHIEGTKINSTYEIIGNANPIQQENTSNAGIFKNRRQIRVSNLYEYRLNFFAKILAGLY